MQRSLLGLATLNPPSSASRRSLQTEARDVPTAVWPDGSASALGDPVPTLAGGPTEGDPLPALRGVGAAQPVRPGRVQLLAVGPQVRRGTGVGAEPLPTALGARGAPLAALVRTAQAGHVVTPAGTKANCQGTVTTASGSTVARTHIGQ